MYSLIHWREVSYSMFSKQCTVSVVLRQNKDNRDKSETQTFKIRMDNNSLCSRPQWIKRFLSYYRISVLLLTENNYHLLLSDIVSNPSLFISEILFPLRHQPELRAEDQSVELLLKPDSVVMNYSSNIWCNLFQFPSSVWQYTTWKETLSKWKQGDESRRGESLADSRRLIVSQSWRDWAVSEYWNTSSERVLDQHRENIQHHAVNQNTVQ